MVRLADADKSDGVDLFRVDLHGHRRSNGMVGYEKDEVGIRCGVDGDVVTVVGVAILNAIGFYA